MKKLFLSLALVAVPAIASAQPTPATPSQHIAWDHSGVDVQKFQLGVDGTFADVPGGSTVRNVALPAMVSGNHTLAVKACYDADCQVSVDLIVRMIIVVAPTNLRIIPAPPEE